jgi:hypothetical protein
LAVESRPDTIRSVWGLRAVVLVATAGLLLAGCDGSLECSNGCWQPTPAEQSFISSLCALGLACCTRNSVPNATTETSCPAAFERAGVSADSSLQAACLSEMQARVGVTLCEPDISDLSDPCVRAIHEPSGPQPPGATCATRADCTGAPGTLTDCFPFLGHGVCIQMAPGKSGDITCLGDVLPDGTVQPSSFAFHAGTNVVPRGVFCARGAGLYCAQTDDPATSACAPLGGAGAPCDSGATCSSGACEAYGVADGFCEPTVSAGASCLDAVCDDASYCAETTASTSVCLPKASTGSACTANIQCASGSCGTGNLCSAETISQVESLQSFCYATF